MYNLSERQNKRGSCQMSGGEGKDLLQDRTLVLTLSSHSGPYSMSQCYGHKCVPCPMCLWERFVCQHDSHSECRFITRHMQSPVVHWQHYSGTNQEPEKDNVSWKTTRVLITDTLSHAYWLIPGGIRKISWICRMEKWREHCRNREPKTFRDIWI